MIVYKQNIADVINELDRTISDMETLEQMYPLNARITLTDAIINAHDIRKELVRRCNSAPAIPHEVTT